MKFLAVICGIAVLVTAAVNHRILSSFDAMYDLLETPLPVMTGALLWKGGAAVTGLLLASAAIIFTGLIRKNNAFMVSGGAFAILLMLGAATVVPAAVMYPVEKAIQESDGVIARPASALAK